MPNPHCEFVKNDGARCGAWAVDGSLYCFNHDPASVEAKQAAVAKGGAAVKRPPLPPLKIDAYRDVQPAVETVTNELREGKISSSEANALLRLLKYEAALVLGIIPKSAL